MPRTNNVKSVAKKTGLGGPALGSRRKRIHRFKNIQRRSCSVLETVFIFSFIALYESVVKRTFNFPRRNSLEFKPLSLSKFTLRIGVLCGKLDTTPSPP